MIIKLMCVLSFMVVNPDGQQEKRVYSNAIGYTMDLNEQYMYVDFSDWMRKYDVDLPYEVRTVNTNQCSVLKVFRDAGQITEEDEEYL